MSDEMTRLEDVRAAGRRLDAGLAQPLNRSGPIARNGEAPGGWLKTLFGGPGRARAESATERAAYLLKCQAVVATHVIPRAETARLPRAGGAAEYQVRQVAFPADLVGPLRNRSRAPATQDVRTVFEQPRRKAAKAANLFHFLR